jgi:hypothetical protein
MMQDRERSRASASTIRGNRGVRVARTAIELHPMAILARDDPEPVMLDFVQPRLAGRWVRGGCGEARGDEARGQGARTHGHGGVTTR